jgi:hypothetical protein
MTTMSVLFYHIIRAKNMTNKLLYFFNIFNITIFLEVTKTITLIIVDTIADFPLVLVGINISPPKYRNNLFLLRRK